MTKAELQDEVNQLKNQLTEKEYELIKQIDRIILAEKEVDQHRREAELCRKEADKYERIAKSLAKVVSELMGLGSTLPSWFPLLAIGPVASMAYYMMQKGAL